MSDCRLFVGNLPYPTVDRELQEYFGSAGVVSLASVIVDRITGRSRGFAFVEMSNSDEADKAVELFHNQEFQGRSLTVNLARPREDRPTQIGRASCRERV